MTDRLGDRVTVDGSPFDTWQDADLALARYRTDVSRGVYLDPRRADTPLGQVVADWIETKDLKPNSMRSLHRFARSAVTGEARGAGDRMRVAGIPVGAFTLSTARRWAKSLTASGVAPVSVHRWWGLMSQVLDHAVAEGMILVNPLAGKDPLPRGTLAAAKRATGHHFLTLEEMVHLTLAARPHWGLLIETILWSGARSGEIRAMDSVAPLVTRGQISIEHAISEDIENQRHWLDVKTTASYRQTPIPRQILTGLAAAATGPGVPIFPGPDGSWMSATYLDTTVWDYARVKAGLLGDPEDPNPGRRHPVTPHDCRATGASLLFACGLPVPEVQRWLGHGSAGLTLDVYTEVQRWGQSDPILLDIRRAGLPLEQALETMYQRAWETYGEVKF